MVLCIAIVHQIQRMAARHHRERAPAVQARVQEALPRESVHNNAALHQLGDRQALEAHAGRKGLPRHLRRGAARGDVARQQVQRSRRRRDRLHVGHP